MRIGFFTDRYLPQIDGIVISVETFRRELENLGHEVYVIAPAPGLRYKEPSKRIIRFPAVKGLWGDYDYLTSFYFPPQALRRLEKLNLDLIHFHGPGQIGLLGAYFAIKNNIPLVTTYHTDLYEYVVHYKSVLPGTIALSLLAPIITGGGLTDYRNALSSIKPDRNIDRWNQKIVQRGITLIHNSCDLVIAPSRKMSTQLQSWHANTPISVIPTGLNKLPSTPASIASWRKKLGLSGNEKVIFYVGRLGSEKNFDLLVKAFTLVLRSDPSARLLIVGDHPDRKEIEAAAHATSAKNNIIFAGYVGQEDLGSLYDLSYIFAFPSLADTQGVVINEAAWAGLPIVMIDKDISSVAQANKNTLYARNNPKDFASKLLRLLTKPELHAAFSRESLRLAHEYTASKQAQLLLTAYDEVIKNHSKNVEQKKSLREKFNPFA